MLISHDWLRAHVAHSLSPEALAELITAHIATVDRMEQLRTDLAPIVVARVLEAQHHPNSDHLWVTKVDDGTGEPLDVVCGAPNVIAGALYPFARVGTVMPTGNKGGILIEKRKIRGATSNGMLCSARELGLGEDHDGILALDVDAAPGTPLLAVLPLGDVQFDIDVLPNRPDLLSHVGMAREIAALTGHAAHDPAEIFSSGASNGATTFNAAVAGRVPLAGGTPAHGEGEAESGGVRVRIDDHEGCPRYMGLVIRGVTVGASPPWLVRRLESIGLRSISNIVDVTNYVLHGYGQPMHAFDVAQIAKSTVIVRRAENGEKLVTLDGVERTLDDRMTVIADADRAIAIAGVMGGRDSEVRETTTDIFLEVAYFSPRNTRVTRRALQLSTDASYRFERGIDPTLAPRALSLAAELITSIAGGRVDGMAIDVGAVPNAQAPILVRPKRVSQLLGDTVDGAEITRLLTSIGFGVTSASATSATAAAEDETALLVSPPRWRIDVAREADLVEEVARLRGYDRLSDTLTAFRPGTVPDHPYQVISRRVRDALVGAGLLEVRPLPFVKGSDETHVRVQNPLADDEPHLRTSILETLRQRAEYNLSRMQGNLRLFEIGSVFSPREGGLPVEKARVGALVMGMRRPPHFTDSAKEVIDVWDAKTLGERIATLVYPGRAVVLEGGDGAPTLWRVLVDGGEVGTVERLTLDKPVWAADAYGVEITIGRLSNAPVATEGAHKYSASSAARERRGSMATYRALPTTPPAEFDLALLVPNEKSAGDVERVIRRAAGDLLESLELFDEFRGASIGEGVRSLAWRLTFRDPTRTLRDKEVDGRRQKIVRALESELGVRPRSA